MTILNISFFYQSSASQRVEAFINGSLRDALCSLASGPVTLMSLEDEEDTCRRAVHVPLASSLQARKVMEMVVSPLVARHFNPSSGELMLFPTVMTIEQQWTPIKS